MNQKKSVILFLVDGMRPDALKIATTPAMDKIIASGAVTYNAQTIMPTWTLPCITSLLLGTSFKTHGITQNKWESGADNRDCIFSAIKKQKMTTSMFYSWEPLRNIVPLGALDISLYINHSMTRYDVKNMEIAKIATQTFQNNFYNFSFIYLGNVDVIAHKFGFMSDEYIKAITIADEAIAKVMEQVNDDTNIIITADHGGHDNDHGTDSPEDMTIPFIMKGPNIPQNHIIKSPVSILDIAPTIMHLLDLKAPKGWQGNKILF